MKKLNSEAATLLWRKLIAELCGAVPREHDLRLAFAAAFVIEQAPAGALDGDTLTDVCAMLARNCDGLWYRNDNRVVERWIICLPVHNSPALAFALDTESTGVRAAVAVSALLLWCFRRLLIRQMGGRKWRTLGLELRVGSAEEARTVGIAVGTDVGMDIPGVIGAYEEDAGQRQLVLLVTELFQELAGDSHGSDRPPTLALLLQLHDQFFTTFTEGRIAGRRGRSLRQEFVAQIFRVRETPNPTTPHA